MSDGDHALLAIHSQLLRAWGLDTSSTWQAGNPALGQCSVTALVIQDCLGGEILKTDVNGAWHFYNEINGKRIDFTMSQFDRPITYDDLPSSRDEALTDCTQEQCEVLRQRMTGRFA